MGLIKWNKTVRVLVADDSLVMRGVFRELFAPGGALSKGNLVEVELCGLAHDGLDCLEQVRRLRPDVLLLDLEMPRMHGLDVLARLRMECPMLPAIMCSSYTERGARTTLDGLARGAADYVTKPTMQSNAEAAMESLAEELLPKIAALAGWTPVTGPVEGRALRPALALVGMGAGAVLSRAKSVIRVKPPVRGFSLFHGGRAPERGALDVVAIGVSTGGPTALEQMLPRLPRSFPLPILIVQHMPKLFTAALADRLNKVCALKVREAHDGAEIAPGTVWLAPGDAHMEVGPTGDGQSTVVRIRRGEPLNHYMPAVDYLFETVAKRYGAGALALVMTGMGSDGLEGSRAVREAGGTVLVQDEATSAIWGMPGRVAGAGLAHAMLPLESLAGELERRATRRSGGEAVRVQDAAGRTRQWEGNDGLL